MIGHIAWHHDIDEVNTSEHVIIHPEITDIDRLLNQLDGDIYPSFTLCIDDNGKRFPKLAVYGNPQGYAAWLFLANDDGQPVGEMISYSNPSMQSSEYTYRSIGRTYPGIEIEEALMTTDIDIVRKIIYHFSETGSWHPDVPFIIERGNAELPTG